MSWEISESEFAHLVRYAIPTRTSGRITGPAAGPLDSEKKWERRGPGLDPSVVFLFHL